MTPPMALLRTWLLLSVLLPWSVLGHPEKDRDQCHQHVGDGSLSATTSAAQLCHCYSYENIPCSAAGDAIFDEHIEELKSFCFSNCTYECLQPLEVLRVHYQECPTRHNSTVYHDALASACEEEVQILGQVLESCDTSPRNELAAVWAFLFILVIALLALFCGSTIWKHSQKGRTQPGGVEMKQTRGRDILGQDEQPITLA